MSDGTQILAQLAAGDSVRSEELLPLVYHELRRLAAEKLSHEKPGQTFQATALVHEAYLRLVNSEETSGTSARWASRSHFFAAAAEAMRRILIDQARGKRSKKRGGGLNYVSFEESEITAPETDGIDLLDLDQALQRLEIEDPVAAELVKLRFFAGMSMEEAASALSLSSRSVYYLWSYARAWLRRELQDHPEQIIKG